MTDTLIVIPVRAGSQGLPNKATRLLAGVSPLERLLQTARLLDTDIVVTSNDAAVRQIAAQYGVSIVRQSEALSAPHVPLDAPVHEAVQYMEGDHVYRTVVTLQCTSPFTKRETVAHAIHVSQALDTTVVTVRDDRGLRWDGLPQTTVLTSRAPKRVTRQAMPPCWRETGAIFVTPRAWVTPTFRFAHTAYLLEVRGAEAVDLDAPEDWAIAEWHAGVPSTRECVMARVLGDRYPFEGLIVKFSAWDEETDDTTFRDAMLERLTGELLAPLGAHTQQEAQLAGRIIAMGRDRVSDVLLLTSAYHQVRAFLTMLQALHDHGIDRTIRLWNVPAASRMDKLPDEWRKIAEYQAKGHVASLEDGLAYLDWRDRQGAACVTS